MKLEKYVDKDKKRRKIILIGISAIVLISVSLLLYKTFASFTESAEFQVMKGKVDYFGNSDVYFVFYQGDKQLEEMPQKDNKDNLVFEHGECNNGASIEWNVDEWAPLVKGLNKVKTKCSLYFVKDTKAIRKISTSDNNGMWGYKDKLTKIVIENTKSVKNATIGGKVYGPFDESEYKSKAVESYVVCESNDTNCVGYLQSDGKVVANPDSSSLFFGFSKITTIDSIENFDTSKITNMTGIFYNMSNLQVLDLKSFNTSRVTNMQSMFYGCSSLTSLDLSSFDTTELINVSMMFSNMSNLQEINLSNWKFNDKISSSFVMNSGLSKNLKIENFILKNVDTSNVTNMYSMFSGFNDNSKLTTLDLSSFNTKNVTRMVAMFAGSSHLQELDLSNFDTSNVVNFNNMFTSTNKLKTIKFGSNFVYKTGATTVYMFGGCLSQDRPTDSSWQDVNFN